MANRNESEEFTEKDPLQKNTGEKLETGHVEIIKSQTFCEKCRYIFNNITFEPTMVMFTIAWMIVMTTTQNLSLEKACRVNLNFTDEICTSLRSQSADSQNEYERETQKLLATVVSRRTYIGATAPAALAIFVGSYSDITGRRRFFVLMPLIGQMLASVSNIINTYFFYELSLEVLVFSEAFFEGFSGGWCVCFTTIFSYMAVITSKEDRTFRLGIVNFCFTVGIPIGIGVSGVLLKNLGFFGCYIAVICMQAVNCFYTLFFVKDPIRTPEQKKHDGQGVRYFFRTFFDLSNIKETVKVVFKNGPNRRRLRMCVLMVIVTFLFGPVFGELSVMYMSTRYRFNWDEVKYSLFQAYNFITHTIGTVFSITVFSKYLQWHDSMLGIISTVSKIAASFVYCFAPNETIFFIGPMVEILNGTSMLALRSIFSKLVAADEIGKVNSLIGLTETLMPLAYVPLYTQVYTATMEVLPGAVFLLGAAMTLPAVVVFIWLFVEHRRGLRKKPVIENGTEVPLKQM
ncbi:lysosomal proton-coupled steroid conjugate and bile acid symporter SLC46A3-like [Ostrinia nubilalis]|uniref:lysosomal proton-coupled steroid conjugate and bile acid symporter SLC46A3-like n=1 Tax=Ostrinia nubilalis TaxID=29057 RepID=UPI003082439E